MVPRVVAGAAVAAGLVAWAIFLHDSRGREASFTVAAGAAFGAILQRSRFCFASAFRDLFLMKKRRVAMGLLAALAVGSVGYIVVFGAQLPDARAGYLPRTAHVTPAHVHLVLGGLSFGLGMVLAGGCISGHLYRLGEGSLLAPAALAGLVPGYWLGYALWNFLWVKAVATAPLVWLPASLGYAGALGLQLAVLGGAAALLLRTLPAPAPPPAEPLDGKAALRKVFVEGWPAWVGGAAIGVLAMLVLYRTRPLGVTSEIGRLTLLAGRAIGLAPARVEGLEGLKGCWEAGTETLTQGALFLIALVAGSLAAALEAGEFRIRSGRPRAFAMAFGGGILLGFGAMISLGCTVGTFLSGVMAFSLSGWLFALGLVGGAWAGSRVLRRLA